MRRRLQVGLGALVALGLAAGASFAPLVRARAHDEAERHGLALSVAEVRPGTGRIWLRGIDVTVPEAPSVSAHLDAVEVVFSGAHVAAIVVHGGSVSIRGEPSVVLAELRAWRERRPAAEGGPGEGPRVSVRGLSLSWSEVAPGAEPQLAWGLSYQRDADQEHIAADLVRMAVGAANLEVTRAQAVVTRSPEGRRLARVDAEQLTSTLDIDFTAWRDALGLGAEAPAAGAGSAPPPVPAAPAGARSRPAAATPASSVAPVVPAPRADRGARLRAAIARAAALTGAAVADGATLSVDGLEIRLRHAGQALVIGPARVELTRVADRLRVSLTPRVDAQADALSLSVATPIGEGPVEVELGGGAVTLSALGARAGDFGLEDVERARIDGRGKATLSADGTELAVSGHLGVAGLSLRQEWLSASTVRGLSVSVRGDADVRLDGSRLRLRDGDVQMGQVHARLAGELSRDGSDFTLHVKGGVPLAACEDLLRAFPRGLAPLLDGMTGSGTFALDGELSVDSRDVDRIAQHWSVTNDCRFEPASPDVDPQRFARPWQRDVLDASGRPALLHTGPGTAGWVPGPAISRHMETAVLICEDGAFLRHHGFDQEAIENSLRENLRLRRFVRGASTISMQLAKNLYLSREKTITRKLQEAFLTMLLEQHLRKDQILELYLNVIEFGPGLYGIGPAARHYFATDAGQLSLGQALYLASILPNPKLQHFGADGRVSASWTTYLRRLMAIAHKIHRIDDQELALALEEQVAFGVPYSPPAGHEPPGGAASLAPTPADGTEGGAPAPPDPTPEEPPVY